jgi:hypothetical protein
VKPVSKQVLKSGNLIGFDVHVDCGTLNHGDQEVLSIILKNGSPAGEFQDIPAGFRSANRSDIASNIPDPPSNESWDSTVDIQQFKQ